MKKETKLKIGAVIMAMIVGAVWTIFLIETLEKKADNQDVRDKAKKLVAECNVFHDRGITWTKETKEDIATFLIIEGIEYPHDVMKEKVKVEGISVDELPKILKYVNTELAWGSDGNKMRVLRYMPAYAVWHGIEY